MSRSDLRVDDLSCSRGAVTGTISGDGRIVVIGPVPPPVTGRTLVTACLLEELARSGIPCSLVNTAVDPAGSSLRRKVRRAVRLALYTLPIVREVHSATAAYIMVDASPGTIFTVLYALIARLNRTRIVLHHHSYSYVASPTLAMRCLCRIAGRSALHVTPCAEVSAELSARYARIERTAVLSNAFAVDPALSQVRRPKAGRRLVLGHLSNLNVSKGTLTAIECFAELRRRGEPVELHLAGPIQEERIARSIRNAADRFGRAFRYHKALYGADKRAFYAGIDLFLFPTTFRNEVQPLVVLEALAAGCAVIAFGRACIPSLLKGGAGLIVSYDRDFKGAAADQILAWHRNRDALRSASDRAKRRFAELREQSEGQVAQLLTGSQRPV